MFDSFKHHWAMIIAVAIYAVGAFMGVLAACITLALGLIAIFSGTDLVTAIMVAAGISAVSLTVADSGRKRLHVLQATAPRYITHAVIKLAG